ncbi:MAG TPA: NADH-quinone oxidoreductase subunit J [Deltaproteobacteria bacterium]|nr:NADH-quinone oxidoreductase subunit J [Deltaproteobacteria bacterium]
MAELLAKYNYWIYALLLCVGFYGMMTKGNLMKKLIAMNIFQWAVIFYFISIGAKKGGTVPIIPGGHGGGHVVVEATSFINPLPHVLMLTAIVVGVATTGIALALLIRIYKRWGTLEEEEVLERLRARDEVKG